MRVLHLADFHINLTGPRAEDCRRVLAWISVHAADVRPDIVVVAGDVFDRRSSPEERLFLAELLGHLSKTARTFLVKGNHDDELDLKLFQKEYGWMTDVEVVLGAYKFSHAGVRLAFLPWPSLARLAAPGSGGSIVERRAAARSALLDVVRGFREDSPFGPDKPSLLFAHVAVTGASMDSGQPVCGGEMVSLSAEELLESGAAGVALGHIHLQQWMKTLDSRPVVYAGAPFRTTFGEAEGAKGGLIWEWNGQGWTVTPWDTPARRMLLIDANWEDGHLIADPIAGWINGQTEGQDAEIRFRISFPVEEREAARRAAEAASAILKEAGAYRITVDERPAVVSRTRCVEIAKARTPMEKLRTWAEAVGAEVPEGAEAKLQELETEAQS